MKKPAVFACLLHFLVGASGVAVQGELEGGGPALSVPHHLTFGEGNNEDPSVLQAMDGRVYVAWFSSRGGQPDIWIKRSSSPLERSPEKKVPDPIEWDDSWSVTDDVDGDFYPCLIQGRDGTFHLTWFHIDMKAKRFSLRYANSKDGRKWSAPQKVFLKDEFDWVPTLMESRDGSLWIAWCSGRQGMNKEILVIRSRNGGTSWDAPIRVTDDPRADDLPFIYQRGDGSFLITWTRYDSKKGEYYKNKTSEILFATSPDGLKWNQHPPVQITRDVEVDILSSVYSDQSGEGVRVVWVSGREGGSIVEVPISGTKLAVGSMRKVASGSRAGWSPRIIPTTIKGIYVMASTVRHDPERPNQCDIFYRFLMEE